MADSDFSTVAELLALDIIEKSYRDAIQSKKPDMPSYQFTQQAIHDIEVEKALLTHDLFGEDKQAARVAVDNFDMQSYGVEKFKLTSHQTECAINSTALEGLDYAHKEHKAPDGIIDSKQEFLSSHLEAAPSGEAALENAKQLKTSNTPSTSLDSQKTGAALLMALGVIRTEAKDSLKQTAPNSPNKAYYDAVLEFTQGMLDDEVNTAFNGDKTAAVNAGQSLDIAAYGSEKFANEVLDIKDIVNSGVRQRLEINHRETQPPPTVVAPQTLVGKIRHAVGSMIMG